MRSKASIFTLSVLVPFGSFVAPLAANPLGVGEQRFHPDHDAATPANSYTLGAHTGVGAAIASMTSAWSDGPDFFGTLDSWVYNNAGGGLTFVYQFTVDQNSSVLHPVSRATFDGGWDLFQISDAGADSSGTGTLSGNPAWLDHYVGSLGIQFTDSVGLDDATGLANGTNSSLIWFETNANLYQIGNVGLINFGHSAGASAFIVAIPLPGVGLMGLAGLGMVAGIRRRR